MNGEVRGICAHIVSIYSPHELSGKQGIGLGKRAASPTAAERLAKMAKLAEESNKRDYRDRNRQEYEERRAEGRLGIYDCDFLLIISLLIYTGLLDI